MVNVTVEGLVKSFGSTRVVKELDLQIQDGELLVLLGPSGCGKTTTLRCLAGLDTPSSGLIKLGERTVFDGKRVNLGPDKRNIGMVFQSYALWPHMTVRKNIAYPLKVRRRKDELRAGWVEEAAELVDCSALLDRLPGQLSGGQQQRVALARGIVSRPDLVLFDEPLSNLDARLRDLVRAELHQLHAKLGFSAVFVTHDQSEALALGDRIAIMNGGVFEQLDTPQRVFEQPATEFVAKFIGMSNPFELTRQHEGWTCAGQKLVLPHGAVLKGDALRGRIRPESVTVGRAADEFAAHMTRLRGTVLDVEYGGTHQDVIVRVGAFAFHIRVPNRPEFSWVAGQEAGSDIFIGFDLAEARLFDPSGAAPTPNLERGSTTSVGLLA